MRFSAVYVSEHVLPLVILHQQNISVFVRFVDSNDELSEEVDVGGMRTETIDKLIVALLTLNLAFFGRPFELIVLVTTGVAHRVGIHWLRPHFYLLLSEQN